MAIFIWASNEKYNDNNLPYVWHSKHSYNSKLCFHISHNLLTSLKVCKDIFDSQENWKKDSFYDWRYKNTASTEVWTQDPWFTRPVLYHWAIEADDTRQSYLCFSMRAIFFFSHVTYRHLAKIFSLIFDKCIVHLYVNAW